MKGEDAARRQICDGRTEPFFWTDTDDSRSDEDSTIHMFHGGKKIRLAREITDVQR